jgi:hypothetical protein
MANSKMFSFFSGSAGREPVAAAAASLHAVVVAQPAPGRRLREALKEAVPSDSLMGQLRDIIIGPQVRLSEARFEEMLDILEEEKTKSGRRLHFVEQHLNDATEHVTRITHVLEGQDAEISFLKKKFDEQIEALREEQRAMMTELRLAVNKTMDDLTQTVGKRMENTELDLRSEMLELSGTLVRHVENSEKRWNDERTHSLNTLEQRIAQWRAEIDDTRRGDMEKLASSMMDVGRRLMALQENESR